MVKIEKILNYSNDSREALLLITDGSYLCEVFSHPYNLNSSRVISAPINTLLARDIMKNDSDTLSIIALRDQGLSQRIVARVTSRHEPIVMVGEIRIRVDSSLPGDIQVGDKVEFTCARLDLPPN